VFPDRHKNGDRNPSAFLKVGGRGELVAHCNGCGAGWREFVAWVGLPASAWWPRPLERRMDAPKPKVMAEYEYRDRDGNLIAVKTRWQPGFNGRPKSFSWKRPLPDNYRRQFEIPAGAKAWVKSLDGGEYSPDVRNGTWWFGPTVNRIDGKSVRVEAATPDLYRLPDLLASPGRLVFAVEGEKDADRLAGLGFVAVCGPHGSDPWPVELAGWLADREVAVVPHCDRPGVDLMLAVLASCVAVRAASVRWVDLPDPGGRPGYDVSDWLGGLGREDARKLVMGLVKQSPEYKRGLCKAA
jgi:hypothetical protein